MTRTETGKGIGIGEEIVKETGEEAEEEVEEVETVTQKETEDTNHEVGNAENDHDQRVRKGGSAGEVLHLAVKEVAILEGESPHFTGMYRHQDLNTLLLYKYVIFIDYIESKNIHTYYFSIFFILKSSYLIIL